MKRKNQAQRYAGIAISVATALAAAWLLQPQPPTVEVARVTRGALAATVVGEGRTQVEHRYVVAAPVDGDLERIAIQPGDRTTTDTVVARIWPIASRPLDARSRAEAAAALDAARAAVAQADAGEREARAAAAHADRERERTDQLVATGAESTAAAEAAAREVQIRKSGHDAAIAAARAARAELARAAATLSPDPPAGAPAAIVRAPIAGNVLRVLRESGGPVALGTPLAEVGDLGQLEVVADLLSSDAAAVRPGARATITGWGGDLAIAARVRRVDPAAFTKVSALGLEEQRVHVILDLIAPPPPGLGHDYRVDVAIVSWEGQDVLAFPSTALFRDGDRWAVFAVRDGRARITPIDIGAADRDRTVVRAGLGDGDQVVVQPSDSIRDGSLIDPYRARHK